MAYEAKFRPEGTLVRPGPIGRGVRLLMAALLLKFVWNLVRGPLVAAAAGQGLASWSVPRDPLFWVVMVALFWGFPYVVNLSLGKDWRHRSQATVLGIVLSLGLFTLWRYGSFWSPALGWFLLLWLMLSCAYGAVAFLLAGLLGTPGCEMRAFHHLRVRLSGGERTEHHCPGFLDKIDVWEARLRERKTKGDLA